MRYLGLVAAIVVVVYVFAYVTRLPTSPEGGANANSYAATINSVRNTIHTAGGAEQRRKWAIAQQMRSYGTADDVAYRAEGENAETLVVMSETMGSMVCSNLAGGEVGTAAAAVGFTSISCRTPTDGIILEKDLP